MASARKILGVEESLRPLELDEPLSPRDIDSSISRRFATLLQELNQAHVEEIRVLQQECRRLRQHSRTNGTTTQQPGPSNGTAEDAVCAASSEAEEPGRTLPSARSMTAGAPMTSSTDSDDIAKQRASQTSGLAHIRSSVATSKHSASAHSFVKFVWGKWFDVGFCILILFNATLMAFEAQYYGYAIGHTLEYRGHEELVTVVYPGAGFIIEVLSWTFGILFTIEIICKLITSPRMFVWDVWNWFDLFVVVLWFVSKIETSGITLNSTFLRLARLGRLLRLLKLARKLQGFDALFVITTAMKGCVSVLFWTFVMLALVQLTIALFLTQYLHAFYFLDASGDTDHMIVFTYFGTFIRAFFSMFEVTLGNWPPACRILAENVGEAFFIFGMLHKLSVGFAIVAIINGVFIQETFRVSAMDDVLMVRQKEKAFKVHKSKMEALFKEADRAGDGEISLEEWKHLLDDDSVKMWLSSMELDTRDAELVFHLIDESGDGSISFKELVGGVSRLKGGAKSIDLLALSRQHLQLRDDIRILQQQSGSSVVT